MNESAAALPGPQPHVWVVEDEPAAAQLARELCEGCGCEVSAFDAPLGYLSALRAASAAPAAVVLDWQLERELSAALYLATRHRYPEVPVIYWTGSSATSLPTMIREDAHTTVIDKARGTAAFEEALDWALAFPPPSGRSA